MISYNFVLIDSLLIDNYICTIKKTKTKQDYAIFIL